MNNFSNNSTFSYSIKKEHIEKLKFDMVYKKLFQIILTETNKNDIKNKILLQIKNNYDTNTSSYFLDQITYNFNLTKIQFFKNYSYNGCRKKKWLSG